LKLQERSDVDRREPGKVHGAKEDQLIGERLEGVNDASQGVRCSTLTGEDLEPEAGQAGLSPDQYDRRAAGLFQHLCLAHGERLTRQSDEGLVLPHSF